MVIWEKGDEDGSMKFKGPEAWYLHQNLKKLIKYYKNVKALHKEDVNYKINNKHLQFRKYTFQKKRPMFDSPIVKNME